MFGINRLSVSELLLNYMKEKYQEEFTPGFCEEASWAYSYDKMKIISDKFPEEFIHVYRYENNVFKDNYISFLFREEIEKIVMNIVEPLFGRCKVIMIVSNLPVPVNLTKENTLNDYLKNCQANNKITIYLENYDPAKNYMEAVEKMTTQFKDKLLPSIIDFYFLNKDKTLDDITRKTIKELSNTLDDDLWFEKSVHLSYLENYEFDREKLRQKL